MQLQTLVSDSATDDEDTDSTRTEAGSSNSATDDEDSTAGARKRTRTDAFSAQGKTTRCKVCDEPGGIISQSCCLTCAQVMIASLADLKVQVLKLDGNPVLQELPTIRGNMEVGDVKSIYMIGMGVVTPNRLQIVPAVPSGFFPSEPLGDDQLVGLHGDVVTVLLQAT